MLCAVSHGFPLLHRKGNGSPYSRISSPSSLSGGFHVLGLGTLWFHVNFRVSLRGSLRITLFNPSAAISAEQAVFQQKLAAAFAIPDRSGRRLR